MYNSILSLTSALDEGWVVKATPRPLSPRERPGTHCTGAWVGPLAVWTDVENLALTEIRYPDRPERRESLYRLSYTGPLLIVQHTYSMEQSPSWEAKRFSASPEIPRILWNPKIHYCIRTCPPPFPNLSQLDSVHIPISHIPKIQLCLGLPSGLFPSGFPTSILPHTRYMPRPSHSSRFYYPNNIGWGVQIIKLLIT